MACPGPGRLQRQRRVHVAVIKKGREILFDFSASDEQARGPVNVTSALIKNTCYFGLMAMTDASLPFNHGFVDVIQTKFKEGTIVCPRHGAPVSYYVPLAYLTADVVLKEQRRLVLMPRETPLHLGHCKLLYEACQLGAIIAPPMPGFYGRPTTIAELVDHSVGRVLDLFGIDAGVAFRWQGPAAG